MKVDNYIAHNEKEKKSNTRSALWQIREKINNSRFFPITRKHDRIIYVALIEINISINGDRVHLLPFYDYDAFDFEHSSDESDDNDSIGIVLSIDKEESNILSICWD